MLKHKNHKTNFHSTEIHITAQKPRPVSMTPAKKVVITVIVGAMLSVLAAIVFCFVYQPGDEIRHKLAKMAENYYEEYLYEDFTNSDKFKRIDNIEKAMQKYHEKGFSRVTLRQMILHEKINTSEISYDSEYVKNNCNEDHTYVQIFPDPPYDKKSYHIEYTYSCNF